MIPATCEHTQHQADKQQDQPEPPEETALQVREKSSDTYEAEIHYGYSWSGRSKSHRLLHSSTKMTQWEATCVLQRFLHSPVAPHPINSNSTGSGMMPAWWPRFSNSATAWRPRGPKSRVQSLTYIPTNSSALAVSRSRPYCRA